MDVIKILAQLRQEREQIDEALLSLERLARSRGRTRGQPPAWMPEVTTKRRGRPLGSKSNARATRAAATRGERSLSLNPE